MTPRFTDLQPHDVGPFVAEQRAFDGLWLFHHIPKTAGTSIVAELNGNAGPYHNAHIVYTDELEQDPTRLMDEAVDDLLARHAETGLRTASGHLAAHQVARVRRAVPSARLVTFLRHPLARVVSEYHYNRSPQHPPHAMFGERYPTLDAFAADPLQANLMATYLFGMDRVHGPDRITPEQAVEELAATYDLVGLQDRYPLSFLLLSSCLWSPSLPVHRERVGSAPPEAIDRRTRTRILEANDLDLALHDAVGRTFDRIGTAIWQELRPRPSPGIPPT